MFDFGDELTIARYRIPWLIWIQILVLFLLIVLLYFFSISSLDLTDNDTQPSSSSGFSIIRESSLDKPLPKPNSTTVVSANHLQTTQVGENQSIKGEIATSTSRRIVGGGGEGEDMTEREGPSSSKDSWNVYFHPCYYVRLARLAFLKCLGLDTTLENSSSTEQRQEK